MPIKIKLGVVFFICAAMGVACSSAATSLPPEIPTSTVLPTATTSTSDESSSMGTPVPMWEDLPVMSEAIEGRPTGSSYIYAANVTLDEAETYYTEQLNANGWALSKRQTSETSLFGGPAVILDFERGQEQANVMLIFSTTDNNTLIMLTSLK